MAGRCTIAIEIATVTRTYHVYKEIWTTSVGEILFCQQETENLFAVAIV